MTANNESKIIEPVNNRCVVYDLDQDFHNHKELVKDIALRCISILENENVEYNKEDLVFVVKNFFPSTRKIIMQLQKHSTSGTLVVDKDSLDSDSNIEKIIDSILNKDFEEMRKRLAALHDTSILYSFIYENIDSFPKEKMPMVITTIAKYQANHGLVRDPLVNTAACCVELMQI
jgi:replication factor C small subunit